MVCYRDQALADAPAVAASPSCFVQTTGMTMFVTHVVIALVAAYAAGCFLSCQHFELNLATICCNAYFDISFLK